MGDHVKYNTHFLYPANLYATVRPYLINTILGSCVSVCLYDPIKQIGGMNHYMLPLWNGQGLASPKYGNIAIEKLLKSLEMKGADPNHIEAKVFGGAEVLESGPSGFKIGQRNVDVAMSMLERYHIRIKAKHVGGKLGRKMQFNTYTSEVRMKMIEKVKLEQIS